MRENFQNNIVLSFGEPKTAIFAHIDSIGYTVSYNNNVVKIGGSKLENDISLVGEDSQGNIETILKLKKKELLSSTQELSTGELLFTK